MGSSVLSRVANGNNIVVIVKAANRGNILVRKFSWHGCINQAVRAIVPAIRAINLIAGNGGAASAVLFPRKTDPVSSRLHREAHRRGWRHRYSVVRIVVGLCSGKREEQRIS